MKIVILSITLCVLLAGCRRELDLNYIDYAQIDLAFDWRGSGIYPDDATVLFYPKDGGTYVHYVVNRDRDVIRLRPGIYSVVAFNQKFEDFEGIEFRDLESYRSVRVELKSVLSSGDTIISEMPDPFAFATIDEFEITQDMVEQTKVAMKVGNGEGRVPVATITFNPRNFVHTCRLSVRIDKINSVHRVLSGFVGFCRSLRLSDAYLMPDKAINVVDLNDFSYLPSSVVDGMASSNINIFGIFGEDIVRYRVDRESDPISFYVNIVLRDKDRTEINTKRDITQKMISSLAGNEHVVIGEMTEPGDDPIIPPDVEPEDDPGGGFDPGVEGWGDEEDIDLDL